MCFDERNMGVELVSSCGNPSGDIARGGIGLKRKEEKVYRGNIYFAEVRRTAGHIS